MFALGKHPIFKSEGVACVKLVQEITLITFDGLLELVKVGSLFVSIQVGFKLGYIELGTAVGIKSDVLRLNGEMGVELFA